MINSKYLDQFKLKEGDINFLIGIPGNGFSYTIQNEIINTNVKNVSYLSFSSIGDKSELNSLQIIGQTLLELLGNSNSNFELDGVNALKIVQQFSQMIKQNTPNTKHLKYIFILDAFQSAMNFSDEFFFALERLLIAASLIDSYFLTTIIASDAYFDPTDHNLSIGKREFFDKHFNVRVIPSFEFKQINWGNPDTIAHYNYKLSGGNPWLRPVLINKGDAVKQNNLLDDLELEWKIQEIWRDLGNINQEFLKNKSSRSGLLPNLTKFAKKFLAETGIYDFENQLFKMQILEQYLQKNYSRSSSQDNFIQIGQQTINLNELTPQLELVLKLLVSHQGQLVSKEVIAKELWQSEWENKYSDTALDKLISQLRKIITQPDGKQILFTQKKKGYILNA